MANNIVCYIGLENFDIIIYLSRLLQKLGHKVLIVDYSETSALTYSIPKIQGLDPNSEYISYRNVDFTRKPINSKIAEMYDDILIDSGFSKPAIDLSLITRVIYVTNMFYYNLKRLSTVTYDTSLQVDNALLIREAMEITIPTEYIEENISKHIPREAIDIIYRDDTDFENCLTGHYSQFFSFSRISKMLKGYLIREVGNFYPDIPEKRIKLAYDSARKG
jgi:hypothetical protein